ncbi:MAG: rRNA maturation RNase YbeY [Longicatena sp.]
MEINIINQSMEAKWTRYKKDFVTISEKTSQVLKLKEGQCASVIFVTPEQIHEINRTYRGIDRPTDVISFALKDSEEDCEIMDGEEELGDIFINIEAIKQQAKEYGHSIRREVCFLFTHGILHLLGYDHMNQEDERVMFALQDDILNDIVPKKVRS